MNLVENYMVLKLHCIPHARAVHIYRSRKRVAGWED